MRQNGLGSLIGIKLWIFAVRCLLLYFDSILDVFYPLARFLTGPTAMSEVEICNAEVEGRRRSQGSSIPARPEAV